MVCSFTKIIAFDSCLSHVSTFYLLTNPTGTMNPWDNDDDNDGIHFINHSTFSNSKQEECIILFGTAVSQSHSRLHIGWANLACKLQASQTRTTRTRTATVPRLSQTQTAIWSASSSSTCVCAFTHYEDAIVIRSIGIADCQTERSDEQSGGDMDGDGTLVILVNLPYASFVRWTI